MSFAIPFFGKKATSAARSDTLQSMDFVDQPRDRVIAHARVLARMLHDHRSVELSDNVATGQTAVGETAIFEISDGGGTDMVRTTAVAFRALESAPDFRIDAVLVGDRLLPGGHDADIGAPGSLSRYDHHTHQWSQPELEGLEVPVMKRVAFPVDADFAHDYFVWSSDADAMRRVLTADAMTALVAVKNRNLFILKRLGWLVIWGGSASTSPSPRHYPELLAQAVDLARQFDGKAALLRAST